LTDFVLDIDKQFHQQQYDDCSEDARIAIGHNIKVHCMLKIDNQVQLLAFVVVLSIDKQIFDEIQVAEGNNTCVLFIDSISVRSSDNIIDNF
jgi:hypothetical protein